MTDDYELHERYAILLEENNISEDDKDAKFKYWRQAKQEIENRKRITD